MEFPLHWLAAALLLIPFVVVIPITNCISLRRIAKSLDKIAGR
jgi:hypothetical protein